MQVALLAPNSLLQQTAMAYICLYLLSRITKQYTMYLLLPCINLLGLVAASFEHVF